MKLLVQKQTNKIGDEYMQQNEVEMDISRSTRNEIIIEVDGNLYFLPEEVFKGA